MCILFLYNGAGDNSDYSLIVASNRDELYRRPSKNMWYWDEDPNVIGGRDLEDDNRGTWLAIAPTRKKLGVLLNLPRTPKPNAKTRGKIVADYVKSDLSTKTYVESLKEYAKECNDFIFIGIEFKYQPAISTYSNNSDKLTSHSETCLGFGNSLPDTPLAKVEAGRKQLEEICQRLTKVDQQDQLVEELIQLLKSKTSNLPDPELEKRRPEKQKSYSSIFVSIPELGFGTRTHTIILITKKGHVDIVEMSLQAPIDIYKPNWQKTEFNISDCNV